MTLTMTLSESAATAIRETDPDLEAYAFEALAVRMFRDGKLSKRELGHTLKLDRWDTNALLQRLNVPNDYWTSERVEQDVEVLNRLLGAPR